MRTCLSFLLAVMLSLNAAYAATVGVCDVLEHTSSQAAHLGHHSHEHNDDHDNAPVSADAADEGTSAVSDHHSHVHPSFSFLLPGIIDAMPLTGCNSLLASPASNFDSAPQSSLDHPPRAALA